jgi:hypothetical protein
MNTSAPSSSRRLCYNLGNRFEPNKICMPSTLPRDKHLAIRQRDSFVIQDEVVDVCSASSIRSVSTSIHIRHRPSMLGFLEHFSCLQ